MKYIWLGIKDYCKDVWHDFLFRNLQKCYKRCPIKFISNQTGVLLDMAFWKEGNLWHYIQQRKAAKLLKEIKNTSKRIETKGCKMKQYQYIYVMALLTYIAAKVSNYTGFLWGILSVVFWVLGIILACKNK